MVSCNGIPSHPIRNWWLLGIQNGKEVMRTERRSHGPAHTLQALG